MDLNNMLAELRSELQQIEEAILVVQRLAAGGAKRRGRPPKWMASEAELPGATTASLAQRKRKAFSAATRKKMAEAQRKRWAAVKRAA